MLGLGLELGGAVGLGSSPEHRRDNAANLHCFGRTMETPGHLHCHKGVLFFPRGSHHTVVSLL